MPLPPVLEECLLLLTSYIAPSTHAISTTAEYEAFPFDISNYHKWDLLLFHCHLYTYNHEDNWYFRHWGVSSQRLPIYNIVQEQVLLCIAYKILCLCRCVLQIIAEEPPAGFGAVIGTLIFIREADMKSAASGRYHGWKSTRKCFKLCAYHNHGAYSWHTGV